jgi:hypothetical protein
LWPERKRGMEDSEQTRVYVVLRLVFPRIGGQVEKT